MVGHSIEAIDRWFLHTQGKESGEDPLWTGSFSEMFFENLWSVIYLFSDLFVSSEICGTAFSFLKGGMIPGTGRNLLSEFFGVYYGADELSADFPSICELSPVDHLKTSDTDASSYRGDFELPEFFPAWVSGNSGQGMELIDNKPKVAFWVIRGIAHDSLDCEAEMLTEAFEQRDKEGCILHVGRFRQLP